MIKFATLILIALPGLVQAEPRGCGTYSTGLRLYSPCRGEEPGWGTDASTNSLRRNNDILDANVGSTATFVRNSSTLQSDAAFYVSTGSIDFSAYFAINGGNVGVGTNTPSRRLQVHGDGTAGAEVLVTNSLSNDAVNLILQNNAGTQLQLIHFDSGNTAATWGITRASASALQQFSATAGPMMIGQAFTGPLSYLVLGAGNAERIRINESGWTGINMSTPTNQLHIFSTSTVSNLMLESHASAQLDMKSSISGRQYSFQSRDTGDFRLNDDTASTNRLTLISSGNIGIGTTTVTSLFDIFNGSLTIRGTDAGIRVGTNVIVEIGGNVGVGTTSPSVKFHVDAGTVTGSGSLFISSRSAAGAVLTIRNNASNGVSQVLFQDQDSNSRGSVGFSNADSTASGQIANSLSLQTFSSFPINFITNSASRMVIDSGGNVGISSSSPTSLLSVGGATMAVRSDGFIGFGTTSPSELVQINKAQPIGTRLRITNTDTGNASAGIDLESDGGRAIIARSGTGFTSFAGTADDLFINEFGGGDIVILTESSEKMRLLNNGNLGISTAAPAAKLSIDAGVTGNGLLLRSYSLAEIKTSTPVAIGVIIQGSFTPYDLYVGSDTTVTNSWFNMRTNAGP